MIIRITAKCSDLFSAQLRTNNGQPVGREYDGYVPSIIPEGDPDHVELEIDVKSGKIVNWKPIKKADLVKVFGPDVHKFKM